MASNWTPDKLSTEAIRADIKAAGDDLINLAMVLGKYHVQCPQEDKTVDGIRRHLNNYVDRLENMLSANNDSEVENDRKLKEDISKQLRINMTKENKLRDQCIQFFGGVEGNLGSAGQLLKCQLNLHCKDYMSELQSRQRSLHGHVRLLVAGVMKAGKSSLFNMFLGGPYLPVARGTTTTVCCEVSNSDQRSVEVTMHGRPKRNATFDLDIDPNSQTWQKVRSWLLGVPPSHNGEERLAASLTIKWPLPFLERDEAVTLIDTPGILDDERSIAMMSGLLNTIDGYMILLNSIDGTGLEDKRVERLMQVIREANEKRNGLFLPHNCLFICNKMDTVPEQERVNVLPNAHKELKKIWPQVKISQLVECDASEKALSVLKQNSFSGTFENMYRAVCKLVQTSQRQKIEMNIHWLDLQILEKALVLTKNIETFSRYAQSKKEQVREHLQKDMVQIDETERKINSIAIDIATGQQVMVDTLCGLIKVSLQENKDKICNWSEEQMPSRNEDEAWHEFHLRIKKCILQRIDECVNNDINVKEKSKQLAESTANNLRRIRTCHDEMRRSMSQELNDVECTPFKKCTQQPTSKGNGVMTVGVGVGMIILLPLSPIVLGCIALYEVVSDISQKNDEDRFGRDPTLYMHKLSSRILEEIVSNKLNNIAGERLQQISSNVATMVQFYQSKLNDHRNSINQLKKALKETSTQTNAALSDGLSRISEEMKQFYISEVAEASIDPTQVFMSGQIGSGSFGRVLKAKLKLDDTDTDIAVKVVPAPAALDMTAPDNLFLNILRELATLRMLTLQTDGCGGNENFIKYLGYHHAERDGVFSLRLYMELCDCSLADIIKQKKLHLPHGDSDSGCRTDFPCVRGPYGTGYRYIINMAYQATKGLEFLHQNEVIHRDIKPSNFLVKVTHDRHVVKIADLGQARTATLIATRGFEVGTFLYNPPEVLRGDLHTKSSDVYSLGLVIWELWYGRTVFSEIPDSKLRSANKPMPKFTSNEPPEKLKELLKVAFARDVIRRPTTKDFITSLLKLDGSEFVVYKRE